MHHQPTHSLSRHKSNKQISLTDHYTRDWFRYVSPSLQKLIRTSIELYVSHMENPGTYEDYTFIIFPLSKAYEGFLKQYLRDLGLISKKTYEGKRFRIGRAMNPDIRQNQRDEYWLFDNVAEICGKELARQMWNTWLECRNQRFHYFPGKEQTLSFDNIEKYLQMMVTTMDQAVACQPSLLKQKS